MKRLTIPVLNQLIVELMSTQAGYVREDAGFTWQQTVNGARWNFEFAPDLSLVNRKAQLARLLAECPFDLSKIGK